MNTQPPPHVQPPGQKPGQQPTQPPGNKAPKVPSQPPAFNSGVLTTGPSNLPASDPFTGLRTSQTSNIFNLPGPRPSEMDKLLENDQKLPETPTKTNQKTLDEVYKLVNFAVDDEELLSQFRSRVSAVQGNKSVKQRKNDLRKAIQPWIDAGLRYGGPRRPGLFLPDGTRNPERAPRDAPGDPPPPPPAGTVPAGRGATTTGTGAATGGPQRQPAGTGKPPSGPAGPPKSTKGPPPAGTGKPPGRKGPNTTSGLLKSKTSGIRKDSSSGRGKGSSKDTAKSPLSQPPITTENVQATAGLSTGTGPSGTGPHQDPPEQTVSGRGGAGWPRRDDLFEDNVMDEAGITSSDGRETVTAVPTLESTIDYDTENWE